MLAAAPILRAGQRALPPARVFCPRPAALPRALGVAASGPFFVPDPLVWSRHSGRRACQVPQLGWRMLLTRR